MLATKPPYRAPDPQGQPRAKVFLNKVFTELRRMSYHSVFTISGAT